MQKLWQLTQDQDYFAACAQIETQDDPAAIAALYAEFANWALSDKRDVPTMTAISRAGIQYCLTEAKRCETENAELARRLKGSAKAMAYNLGSNTWPGWNDEGIAINASDLAAGMDAARLNLRLGKELERGPEPMGNAYWLVGAHHLAGRQYRQSLDAFNRSAAEFKSAGKEDFELMARGYASLARVLEGTPTAKDELKAAIAALNGQQTDDAKFFAQQIETAREVLERQRPADGPPR